MMTAFPSINMTATGERIVQLRTARGLSVKDLQEYFGFDAPQAIYKWQKGLSLPSVDNLLALSTLLQVPMESILVCRVPNQEPSGSVFLCRQVRRGSGPRRMKKSTWSLSMRPRAFLHFIAQRFSPALPCACCRSPADCPRDQPHRNCGCRNHR